MYLSNSHYMIYALVLGLCIFFSGGTQRVYADQRHDQDTLTIALTAAFVSEEGIDVYEDIAHYIEGKTGHHVEFISGLSYSVINSMIESGAVQIGFVCGYPYILSHDGQENPPTKLLVAPVHAAPHYKNEPKYYSYIIVHKDSPINTFDDLKGKRWVYNDEISNSGYNMPRAKMVSIGATDGFFSNVVKSGSHEQSIRMVGERKTDASAVDSLVLDYALSQEEPYASQVKIIETLGPAGVPPVVYSTHLSEDKMQDIKEVLLNMNHDPQGRVILAKANLSAFVDVDEENYDDIRAMEEMAKKAGFMEIR